ncbi:helix-turn-helix domain-containing protein [Streptomyces sp. H27-D2]|uniref:helix-turn-helix domain-containing protein n=1 Tax=Streptomyces sp. H27-D2 TaxID=3046304 RepID=UPI002DB844E9|nr:helix-turn-helix domain-containing protein [Streptomyces sp. H27-D2]MEC4018605.1 helix-turn-helix domain-containing protein [Streptomyces sp. H27-D2]
MIVAGRGDQEPRTAADVLTEALSHLPSAFAVAPAHRSGEAIAIVRTDPDDEDLSALRQLWPLLLAGVPADVREVYRARTLGSLIQSDSASRSALLETLEAFLAHNGSWVRTAEALHLHVNTVHYPSNGSRSSPAASSPAWNTNST